MVLSYPFISTVLFPLRRQEKWVCLKATWLLTYNQVIYFLKKKRANKKGWSIAMCSSKLLQHCPKWHYPVSGHTRFVIAALRDELHLHKERALNAGGIPTERRKLTDYFCPSAMQRTGPTKTSCWKTSGTTNQCKKLLTRDRATMGGTLSTCFPGAENNSGNIQGK